MKTKEKDIVRIFEAIDEEVILRAERKSKYLKSPKKKPLWRLTRNLEGM